MSNTGLGKDARAACSARLFFLAFHFGKHSIKTIPRRVIAFGGILFTTIETIQESFRVRPNGLNNTLKAILHLWGGMSSKLNHIPNLLCADDGISPYRALKNKQLSAAIDQAVLHLPADYRELIQLRHFAELSYEEIASMKKLPLGTVKNKLFRARNLLKEALGSFVEPL